ncbi:hypothetical protein R3P38DRAFT_3167435 [Favolaschia claudopus]|uniref:Uncharacterized protein n=1 Tax=Favolaschia claudopus TaxID=2862362 RepID=A0AAW0EBM5_9AGAR
MNSPCDTAGSHIRVADTTTRGVDFPLDLPVTLTTSITHLNRRVSNPKTKPTDEGIDDPISFTPAGESMDQTVDGQMQHTSVLFEDLRHSCGGALLTEAEVEKMAHRYLVDDTTRIFDEYLKRLVGSVGNPEAI